MLKTLTGRVTLIILAATIATTGIVSGIEYLIHEGRLHTEDEERFRFFGRQTFHMLKIAMQHHHEGDLDATMVAIAKDPGVEVIRIIDSDGKIQHSTHRSELGSRADGFDPAWLVESGLEAVVDPEGSSHLVSLREPMSPEVSCRQCHPSTQTASALEMRLRLPGDIAAYEAERFMLLAIVGVQLLVFAILWLLLRLFLIKPVDLLLQSMRKVAGGNLAERVELESPSEFRELGSQFNTMVGQLEEANRQIANYYQQSMERADRLATLGEMATAMSHEIRNPLAGLKGALNVLRKEESLAAHLEILEEMYSTVDRLGKTTTDLLSYGSPSQPTPNWLDVNHEIHTVLFFVRQQIADDESTVIEEDLAENLPPAWGDSHQLQQILLNVALNAIQAMPDGGKLTIRSSLGEPAADGYLSVRIADTGQGMSEDTLVNVFNPFFTTKMRGTGLGLAISKRIVEEMEGRILIRSKPGRGSTIEIQLPIRSVSPNGEDREKPGDRNP